jgi:hypothetical protein
LKIGGQKVFFYPRKRRVNNGIGKTLNIFLLGFFCSFKSTTSLRLKINSSSSILGFLEKLAASVCAPIFLAAMAKPLTASRRAIKIKASFKLVSKIFSKSF